MLLRMALRNALRNRRRSLLTVAMIALGVALLTVAMAWIDGVLGGALDTAARNFGPVRIAHADYARREQVMPLEANLPEVDPLVGTVAAAPGVRAAYARITLPVTVAAGGDLGERFALVQGAPRPYFSDALDLDGHLVQGSWFAGDDDALVGQALAEQLGVKPGGELVLLGQTQDGSLAPMKVRVAGVVALGNPQQERQVYVDLGRAQWMADLPGGATEILAFGEDRTVARGLAATLRARLGEAADATHPALSIRAWDERPPFDSLLAFASAIHTVSGGVIVFITALGVFNTMLMSILERTAEVGVLRALGMRRREVVALFLLEALLMAAVGGVLGAALGGAGGLYLQEVGVNLGEGVHRASGVVPIATVVYARVSAKVLASAVLRGLVMAVVGGVLPAWRASHIAPVEAMRARR
jgi:putative ABC transport system permease protein